MKLYIESIYTKRIMMMNLLNIVFIIVINLVFSYAFTSNHLQYQYQETYLIDYYYQGVLFIKITIFIISMVLVFQTKYVKGILAIDTIEQGRIMVISKYYLSIALVVSINVVIFFLIFEVTGLFLTVYFTEFSILLLFRLLLFGLYAVTVLLVIYFYLESIYSILFGLFVYFLTIMTGGFYLEINDISTLSKVINLFVSDIVLNEELEYLFIYGDIYVVTLVLALVIVLVRRFIKIDII